MKSICFFVAFMLMGSCGPTEIDDFSGESDVSIMSFNLRYDELADKENRWDNRKESCIEMLKDMTPSVFGIQEGLGHQIRYIDTKLPSYSYVGVGRDDGYSSGEYAAIFYDTSALELLDNGNFWLSETPDYPSLGWDANNIRICTWAKFKDAVKNMEFYVFNTHFDHKGKTAQKESSRLIERNIKEIAGSDTPVFLTGDFNMLIGNSRLEPITNNYYSAQRFADRSDDTKSYNAFGFGVISRNIDFIFYNRARAVSYKTIVKIMGCVIFPIIIQ